MERTYIADLRNHLGEEVQIQGWLQTLRDQKKMQFLILRDHTGLAQIAFEKGADANLAAQISALTTESALVITGKAVENPVVKLGGLEVQLHTLKVENLAVSPLPLDPFAETQSEVDHRLDWRFLDLRRPANNLIFRVQTAAEMAMREFWINNGFIEIHSPKLMGSPSESGAELFGLDYFDRKAYLAQSPQFYKQMAMAAGFERVFEIGPVFRADPSFTSRHMTEFTSVDMEMSWVDSHEDVMAFQERWLQYTIQRVKDQLGDEIKAVMGVDICVPEVPFPRIPMAEAIAILKSMGHALPPEKKGDIDPAGERLLGKYVKEKYQHDFVFVTDWPVSVRPFYHMRYADRPDVTCSFDLLGCGLEITTGAQREHRADVLARQALEKGLHLEPIQFYLDFFSYGCPSHGGFGFGLSRFLMVLLGLGNVREAVFLFRGPNRLHP
ncbi:MAG TPA: aspartate--tRNA(Asn) ligase [Anaerolineaceae bacterium]|nr:aspartate--tRNA(Asn) ligase [Anaerolineaceae bacterium]HPN51406.1 aspartate--tRNA(Asn) ligase [Anaerolineaceae bacterium]